MFRSFNLKSCLVVLITFVAATATAQIPVEPLISMGGIPETFLNQKLPKVYQVGDAHWSYPDAIGAGDVAYETMLNQGVAFYHVFHYIDATRAFNEAIALKPNAILPRLGLAVSAIKLGGDQSAVMVAYKEFQNAQALLQAQGGSPTEIFWVKFFGAYLEGLIGIDFSRNDNTSPLEIFANYPHSKTDIEYLVLGTNMLSDLNVVPLNVLKTNYELAVTLNPKHVGALHYLTHVAEALDDKPNALEYGRLTALYSPESSHIQHMYGHNLPIYGNWKKAEEQFVIADDLHHLWAKENNALLAYDWHYTHNLFLWGYAQLGAGLDTDKALQTLVMSCETEVHHCMTVFYAVAAYGDLAKLKQIVAVMDAAGKTGEAQLFQYTIYWLGLEPGDASVLQGQYANPRANFLYVVNELLLGNDIPDALVEQIEATLLAQLTRAGFDSWSQVLPMAMLLDSTAKKAGHTKVQSAIAAVYKQINFQPKK